MLQVKLPGSLTVGQRQTTKLAASCAKGRTVTTMEHVQLGLSALAAECGVMNLALIPQAWMKNRLSAILKMAN
jgi:hypothetical protein